MMEDRSGLFNEIQGFSQRKLKKVETNVITGLGEKLVEKRGAKGLKTIEGEAKSSAKDDASQRKADLAVGLVIPGLMIGELMNNQSPENPPPFDNRQGVKGDYHH